VNSEVEDADAPEEWWCARPVTEDAEEERIDDTRVPRLDRDLATWSLVSCGPVVCNGHPENQRLMKEGSTSGSCRVYLLLQSTNYLGFRSAISKEPVDLHPPVELPYLPNTNIGSQRIFSVPLSVLHLVVL
jgi:hypothetical protein